MGVGSIGVRMWWRYWAKGDDVSPQTRDQGTVPGSADEDAIVEICKGEAVEDIIGDVRNVQKAGQGRKSHFGGEAGEFGTG